MLTEPEFGVSDYSALIGTVSSLGRCVSGGRGVHTSIGCTLMMVMVILKPRDKPCVNARDSRN